ncbi:MAG: FkbM family methyltransferase [Actinomycetota bacterium]
MTRIRRGIRSRRVRAPRALRRWSGFDRRAALQVEEAEVVRRALAAEGVGAGLVADVGAHRGTVTALFRRRGWDVIAFEPDVSNRMLFRRRFDGDPKVQLSPTAVGEVDGAELDFFTSPQSTGISGLVPFHESHVQTQRVTTTRLDSHLGKNGLDGVDVLKIDTEGFDLFVLRSYDWDQHRHPQAILCEFEDAKTQNVGYRSAELADYLIARDYQVLVSEWHPIEKYGAQHAWRRLWRFRPGDSIPSEAWGNLLAFKSRAAVRSAAVAFLAETAPYAQSREPRAGLVDSTLRPARRLASSWLLRRELRAQPRRAGR